MFRMLSLLVVATMATTILAAPAPTKTISKRSFVAKARGHGKLSAAEALRRAAAKYGFEISETDSTIEERHWDSHDLKDIWPSTWPWPWASQSAAAGYSSPSGSAFAPVSSSVFAVPSGFSIILPSGFSVVPSGFSSVVARSSVVPSSAVASSGSPPVQSSAPASQSAAPSASTPAPSSSSSPSGGADTGSVSADPKLSDTFYISPVTIGGNQQLNLDFDTGSSDLWVFNAQAGIADGQTAFDPTKSSTFTTLQDGSWMISYGDGSTASGTVGFDQVTIGGVTAQKQCVELANMASTSFIDNRASDGLLGLGFSKINTVQPQQQKTFWENVMGALEQPLFTADLDENNAGTYEFGTIDSTKHSGPINYAAVDNSKGFWQFSSPSFSIGGSQQDCGGCSSILDTGTSLIIVTDDIAKAYYSQVNGAQIREGNFEYPCSATLPDFGIAIGDGYTAVIKGSDLSFEQDPETSLCIGGIQSSGTVTAGTPTFNILGDVFLKQYFAVFDGGNLQVGVAPKA